VDTPTAVPATILFGLSDRRVNGLLGAWSKRIRTRDGSPPTHEKVEEEALKNAQRECHWKWKPIPSLEDRAVLGSCGRYHLICASETRGVSSFDDRDARLPERIRPQDRCPVDTNAAYWPGHHETRTKMGRIRVLLAERHGRACHACGCVPFYCVDHDHNSWLVRGGLCRNCNARVDLCAHVSGCPFAEYLNCPPALASNIPFPRTPRTDSLHE
jgi:hypothetical protein